MEDNTKYPRTYHLPFSPGAQKDDRKISTNWDWFASMFKGREVVITEKLDGENSALTREGVYSRSHAEVTHSPWSVNLWGNFGIHWKVKDAISPKEILYGENLYGIHSIEYEKLSAYFFLFAVRDDERWYSWDEVEEFAKLLDIPSAPVLYRGVLKDEHELEVICENSVKTPSFFGSTREGCVVRVADSFPLYECGELAFPFHVAKYVRQGHVQTDEHWTRNWKKAKLIGE